MMEMETEMGNGVFRLLVLPATSVEVVVVEASAPLRLPRVTTTVPAVFACKAIAESELSPSSSLSRRPCLLVLMPALLRRRSFSRRAPAAPCWIARAFHPRSLLECVLLKLAKPAAPRSMSWNASSWDVSRACAAGSKRMRATRARLDTASRMVLSTRCPRPQCLFYVYGLRNILAVDYCLAVAAGRERGVRRGRGRAELS